jgi:hypothetical protein
MNGAMSYGAEEGKSQPYSQSNDKDDLDRHYADIMQKYEQQ